MATLQPSGRTPLALVLDYDGTLVPVRSTPEEAAPDDEILHLLSTLAGLPEIGVHAVSGRTRAALDRWLGHLPVGLHAEHGPWSAVPANRSGASGSREHRSGWTGCEGVSAPCPVEVPGSFVEEKEASLAWHYRNAARTAGRHAAAGLRRDLKGALKGSGASVLSGNLVVEIRQRGIHKGLLMGTLRELQPRARMLIVGDDATDEDMFKAAPPDAVTVRVGPGRTRARFRLAGSNQVRAALEEIAASRGAQRVADGPARPAEGRQPAAARRV